MLVVQLTVSVTVLLLGVVILDTLRVVAAALVDVAEQLIGMDQAVLAVETVVVLVLLLEAVQVASLGIV